MVSRAIESSQRKVEGRNFDIRKQLLEYDDVANEQRKAIYGQRNELLESEDVSETISAMCQSLVLDLVDSHMPPEAMEEQWDVSGLEKSLAEYGIEAPISDWLQHEPALNVEAIKARIQTVAQETYAAKVEMAGVETFRQFERAVMLQHLDHNWREHLSMLDHLRQGIHLRGYAQKNPKQEYKREAFELFSDLLDRIKRDVVMVVMNVQVRSQEDVDAIQQHELPEGVEYLHDSLTPGEDEEHAAEARKEQARFAGVGRNEPCPCGSGKKYKQCHGRLA